MATAEKLQPDWCQSAQKLMNCVEPLNTKHTIYKVPLHNNNTIIIEEQSKLHFFLEFFNFLLSIASGNVWDSLDYYINESFNAGILRNGNGFFE